MTRRHDRAPHRRCRLVAGARIVPRPAAPGILSETRRFAQDRGGPATGLSPGCGRTVIVASRTANTAQWSLRIAEIVGVEYLQKMFKDDVLHRLMNARHVGADR